LSIKYTEVPPAKTLYSSMPRAFKHAPISLNLENHFNAVKAPSIYPGSIYSLRTRKVVMVRFKGREQSWLC
jgi:hypothetical protein